MRPTTTSLPRRRRKSVILSSTTTLVVAELEGREEREREREKITLSGHAAGSLMMSVVTRNGGGGGGGTRSLARDRYTCLGQRRGTRAKNVGGRFVLPAGTKSVCDHFPFSRTKLLATHYLPRSFARFPFKDLFCYSYLAMFLKRREKASFADQQKFFP